jgi:serine protease Do
MTGRIRTSLRPIAALAAVAVVAAACSGSGPTPAPSASAAASPSAAPSATATPAPTPTSPVVGTLDGVRTATIQIEAEGSFVDPTEGQLLNTAGRGSGFILSPDGTALTNNHVVTGAALLKVWVGGDRAKTYNARVVAASECSDLAVIKIDGSGFPTLDWAAIVPTPGVDVYAAGFPLGDPEYTLTRGIISKAKADGETSWASVDSVIEHDATINPGNSGGPLVTKDGAVVGLNYAGNDARQSFAIGKAEVDKILPALLAGKPVNSIGVNGEAMRFDDGTSGIFVASVASGSPADAAGVKGGDFITKLESLLLATDGTMADYCDILRSHTAGDVLAIEVYRPSTRETLEGRLNGSPLTVVSTIETGGSDQGGSDQGGGEAAADYTFAPVATADGAMSSELPTAWGDVKSGNWTYDDETVGVRIGASTDYATWMEGYTVPGAFLAVSASLAGQDVDAFLDADRETFEKDCTYDSRKDFDAAGYVGRFDLYTDCGGTGNAFVELVVKPADGAFLVFLQLVALGDRDLTAADHMIETLRVDGPLP